MLTTIGQDIVLYGSGLPDPARPLGTRSVAPNPGRFVRPGLSPFLSSLAQPPHSEDRISALQGELAIPCSEIGRKAEFRTPMRTEDVMDKEYPTQTKLTAAVKAAFDVSGTQPLPEAGELTGKRPLKPTIKKSRNKTRSAEPVIFTRAHIAMQSLADGVGRGYTYYLAGSAPIAKIKKVLAVFDQNYRGFADRNERARRKRAGLGNVMVVLLQKGDQVVWWVLATPQEAGSHLIHSSKLKNALHPQERIELNEFELVRIPKPGTSLSKLTWRIREQEYRGWRDYVTDTVRHRSFAGMYSIFRQLWLMPGFNGIRSQIGQLVALYRAELKRNGIKGAPQPQKELRYLRRVRHTGCTVSEVLKDVRKK